MDRRDKRLVLVVPPVHCLVYPSLYLNSGIPLDIAPDLGQEATSKKDLASRAWGGAAEIVAAHTELSTKKLNTRSVIHESSSTISKRGKNTTTHKKLDAYKKFPRKKIKETKQKTKEEIILEENRKAFMKLSPKLKAFLLNAGVNPVLQQRKKNETKQKKKEEMISEATKEETILEENRKAFMKLSPKLKAFLLNAGVNPVLQQRRIKETKQKTKEETILEENRKAFMKLSPKLKAFLLNAGVNPLSHQRSEKRTKELEAKRLEENRKAFRNLSPKYKAFLLSAGVNPLVSTKSSHSKIKSSQVQQYGRTKNPRTSKKRVVPFATKRPHKKNRRIKEGASLGSVIPARLIDH